MTVWGIVNVCIQWNGCGSGGRVGSPLIRRSVVGSLTQVSTSKRAIKYNWNKGLCENGFKKSTIWIVHLSQFLINCLAEYEGASFWAVVASSAVLHRCVDGIHINDIVEPKDFPENQDLIPRFYRHRTRTHFDRFEYQWLCYYQTWG